MSLNALREAALNVAVSQNNVRPLPGTKRQGPEIAMYLASLGIHPGANYCVAFVYWCYQQASRKLGCPNPLPKTGSTHALHHYATMHGWLQDTPQRGDIFLSKTLHHTGMVDEAPDISACLTIEGNTMIGKNDRGVHFRKHKDLTGAYFVRV